MDSILSFFLSSQWYFVVGVLKTIFLSITALLGIVIVFLLTRASWIKRRVIEDAVEIYTYRPFGASTTLKQWQKIEKRLSGKNEAEYKLAVMEADSLLDQVLQKMGYKGETTTDRLNQLTFEDIPNLAEVIEAHKIRNNIVHDPDYQFTRDQAQTAFKAFRQALEDLGAFS